MFDIYTNSYYKNLNSYFLLGLIVKDFHATFNYHILYSFQHWSGLSELYCWFECLKYLDELNRSVNPGLMILNVLERNQNCDKKRFMLKLGGMIYRSGQVPYSIYIQYFHNMHKLPQIYKGFKKESKTFNNSNLLK